MTLPFFVLHCLPQALVFVNVGRKRIGKLWCRTQNQNHINYPEKNKNEGDLFKDIHIKVQALNYRC